MKPYLKSIFNIFTLVALLTMLFGLMPTSPAQAESLVGPLQASGDLLWAKNMGGFSNDFGYDIAIDSSGNVYTLGGFIGTADFDPSAGISNLTSAGSGDIFISKLDSDGNFVWARNIGGTDWDYGSDIAIDASNNVYTTGYFGSMADFDPGVAMFNLTSVGGSDIFVSKLDSDGNFVWAESMGGTSGDSGIGISIDSSYNVYTMGYFQDTVDFYPGTGLANLTSAGSDDIFVSKLDSSGNFIWAKRMGGTGYDYGNGVTVDSGGNVYTTGYFGGTADFDPGAGIFNLTAPGSDNEIFVSKLDSSGNFVWAKSMGGTGYDYGNDLALDSSGNIYTLGIFENTADFDPSAGIANLTSAGYFDIFVSKLDNSGNFVWAKRMGGAGVTVDYYSDSGNSITINSSGNIYTTGYFVGAADFDPSAGTTNLFSAGGEDIFVAKLENDGVAPTVGSFTATSPSLNLNIPITTFTASDTVGVTGYIITASSTPPAAGDPGWSGTVPTTYAVGVDGNYTLYPWAKDAAGNVSTVFGSPFSVIVDTTAPTVTMSSTVANSTNASLIVVSVTFSENVIGFISSDITTSNGTVSNFAGSGASYTFDLTPSVNGLVTADIAAGVAQDGTGNDNTAAAQFSRTYDNTVPTVISFTATSPSLSLDIPITAFTASDAMGVSGYMITNSSTLPATGDSGWSGTAPAAYTVGIDGNYTLYPWAKDAAGNVSSVFGSPITVTVDATAPTVVSNLRANASPTAATSVDFTITFSESVTGVNTEDFSLTTTGVSGAIVNGVNGSGTTYTVTVNTGTGNGTIRLDVLNDGSIKDLALNPLGAGFTSGQTYDIEKTAPTVVSSLRVNANPTNLASVDFTVTFSESVTGVDASDFSLTTSGVSGAAASGVSGSGTTYTVTVNTGNGNGTIRLNVVDDDTIVDAVLNPLGAGFTSGEIYIVSKSAVFADVPFSYWASSSIERLYNAGITGGCSVTPLNYCPDSTVTRAQMAVFLLKGIHGSSYVPPTVGVSTGFSDVATDYWAAAWIKQLAAEGITGGCGTGVYCPDATVTRAQMAIFLLRAKHGSSYSPPTATGVFTDVPVGYWADKWIEQLAVEGVTSGCGAGVYCPDSSVTRAQMAVFLVKAFNLP